MRTKKFNKKLNLNKKTIADLDPKKMNGIKGGAPSAFPSGCCSEYVTCGDTCGCPPPSVTTGCAVCLC